MGASNIRQLLERLDVKQDGLAGNIFKSIFNELTRALAAEDSFVHMNAAKTLISLAGIKAYTKVVLAHLFTCWRYSSSSSDNDDLFKIKLTSVLMQLFTNNVPVITDDSADHLYMGEQRADVINFIRAILSTIADISCRQKTEREGKTELLTVSTCWTLMAALVNNTVCFSPSEIANRNPSIPDSIINAMFDTIAASQNYSHDIGEAFMAILSSLLAVPPPESSEFREKLTGRVNHLLTQQSALTKEVVELLGRMQATL